MISRLNDRCKRFFGEVEEVNFRPPVPPGEELIGLKFLFSQSEEGFDVNEHYNTMVENLQTADDSGVDEETVDDAEEEENIQDDRYDTGMESPLVSRIHVTDEAVSSDRDPCAEDVCGPCHLPGYSHVENLCSILVEIALEEGRLQLTAAERAAVIAAWNRLELHDRSIQQFDSLYTARWGYCYFGRSCGDPEAVSIIQKLKFSKRHAPAHLVSARKNRLVYCLLKHLWLHNQAGSRGFSPQKHWITKVYQRLQQRITVDDPELSKLGIPLLKVNAKCVGDFIRREEAMAGKNVTDPGESVLKKTESVTHTSMEPAAELPEMLPQTTRPQMQHSSVPCLSGTKRLKGHRDCLVGQTSDVRRKFQPVSWSIINKCQPVSMGNISTWALKHHWVICHTTSHTLNHAIPHTVSRSTSHTRAICKPTPNSPVHLLQKKKNGTRGGW